MAKLHEAITPALQQFIEKQALFFVATASLDGNGHINLSPKGLDSFRIINPHQVTYLDLTGSGNETAAHITENGRITFMFCAFSGSPLILRLYGQGRVLLPGSPEWPEMLALFPPQPAIRQVIVADIARVQTSCGFGVPLMEFAGHRDQIARWAESKGESGLDQYRQEKNCVSIDGLPAPLPVTENDAS